jgi:cytochrome c
MNMPRLLRTRPLLVASLIGLTAAFGASAQEDQVQRGQELVSTHCARCHAIGKTGESAFPEAPPFRTLHEKYPVESLEEALAEGIVSGHPAMPEFTFEPEEIGAIIAYLRSLAP